MLRQITHWFSRATIRALMNQGEGGLLDSFDSCPFSLSTRQDTMLAGLLIGKGTNDSEDILDILTRLCPDNGLLPDLGKLRAACQSIQVGETPPPKRRPGTGWYTKDICFEFHKLLVSSLIAYANSLCILERVHSKLHTLRNANITEKAQDLIDELQACLPDLFEQVLRCVHIVWRITDSRILRHHCKLLQACHVLAYPSKSLAVGETRVFGHITIGKDSSINLQVVSRLDTGTTHDQVDQEPGEEDETAEFQSMQDIRNLDKSFMRWMQLQVAHRVGQDILTSKQVLSTSILSKLNISVVTATQPSSIDRSMEPWDVLLRSWTRSFPEGFDVEAAINKIKDRITSCEGTSCNPIFQKFQVPFLQPTEFPGNLHCEVILALLVKLAQDSQRQDVPGDQYLIQLIQVWLPLHSNI